MTTHTWTRRSKCR